MTICFFSAQYLPTVGGVERYTYNLAQRSAAAGHRVLVVTSALPGLPARETSPEGIEVFRFPVLPLMRGRFPVLKPGRALRALAEELWGSGIDFCVINTHFYTNSIYAARQARRRNIRRIVIEHGSAYLMTGPAPLRWAGALYEQAAARLLRRWAPDFYGVSSACCRWLLRFGIQAKGCLYNAVDPKDVRAQAQKAAVDWRVRLGIPSSMPLIAYAGRILPEKGVDALAAALPAIRAAVPGACAVLVGDGPLMPSLREKQIEGLYLPGQAPYAHTLALLAQADLFCMPSRSEGFSCTVLEAAALGCPIVTTATGGSPELLSDEFHGLLLPGRSAAEVANACIRALQDASWRETAARNTAYRLEQSFTWQAAAARFLALAEGQNKDV